MLNINTVKQGARVDVAIPPLIAEALQTWASIYVNQAPWLQGDTKSLNLGASIAAEVARDVTIEMQVEVTGSLRADFLNAQLQPVINRIRKDTEYAAAKGGLWFKPYAEGEKICIQTVQGDMGYPVAFDADGNMTAAIFADQKTVGASFYTRLEYHALVGTNYQITNRAFKSSARDTLGTEIALASVDAWAELLPEAIIQNIERPLFAYFKMPFANSIDTTSPLGVSIYARAAQGDHCLLRQADEQWTKLLWEFESGERVVYTTPDAFAKGADGKPQIPNKKLYRLLDLASVQLDKPGFFEDYTPTLREQNYLNGLDAIFRRIEYECGLSYGILSNPESVALTATEIKASKQRYYATVTDVQKSLQVALDNLLYAMDVWCTLAGIGGTGAYTATYQFDDSIIADHDTQFAQDQQVVTMNAMPKYVFLMRNYGLTEVDAKKWVAETQAETPAPSFFPQDNLNA